jgi:hypothetical protein
VEPFGFAPDTFEVEVEIEQVFEVGILLPSY